jgi:hypothetical protein
MSLYKRTVCNLCGESVVVKNLHVHQNASECMIRRETKAATEGGYIYEVSIGNVSTAQWALPFIKGFHTGKPKNNSQPASFRWWAQAWWWHIYKLCRPLKNRVELLEQVKDLYEIGEMEQIDNLVGGIEMAGEAEL